MKTAVRITKNAKNGTFEDCKIYGGIENSGKNISFKKTLIGLKQYRVFNKPRKIMLEIIGLLGAIITLLTWIGIGPFKF